jgi:leucyl/phenylalanyl-tRNA--protein transferase
MTATRPIITIPHWLDANDPREAFPSAELALADPNGLLAIGGDLRPERLLNAYRSGIFPWYEEDQPILWWSPDPRAIFDTSKLNISRSLRKTLRNKSFNVTIDRNFKAVVAACAEPRAYASGTWITAEMQNAYCELHRQGYAHSVEVWNDEGVLTGGLYGVLLDNIFAGESMFSRERDMSKVALVYLAQWLEERGIHLIDCQLPNPHLASLGAITLPRSDFLKLLRRN